MVVSKSTSVASSSLHPSAKKRPARPYRFKYRLALVADGICVLRYDNETGKNDHRHRGLKLTQRGHCRA
jgi:Family of unknown function (DUF6516)